MILIIISDSFYNSCLKFGVGIKNDAARLSDWSNTVTVGCVDLRNIALRCGIR